MSTAPSLYRRHRPRSFDDVVGQEHVVRTLRNAIEQRKLHHAYLFVGSRGTGKTSMAKILAACLNCERGGPTVQPCGECDSCVSIANATSLDVIEMDAASNNSVDDIRDLRDSVAFAPVSGKYKVYILDEAHMLSTAAWNAFLKTLEEPPPSTLFVLATTEANKVLPTVVDRCHRFDFTRPTVEQLARVVQRVADREQIAVPADAVALLARHATGSFRDALGTLEQLVTYSGTEIAVDDVLAVLGVADADLLFGALDAVASHDAASALRAAARLIDTGRDVGQFLRDLEAHARELLVVRTLGEVPSELQVTPDRDRRLSDQSARVAAADAGRLIDLLAAALRATKDGADARTQLELALVKAATPEVDASTRALLSRIERLERTLAGQGATAPPPPQPAPPVDADARTAPGPVAAPAPAAAPAAAPAPAAATRPAAAPPPAPVEVAPRPQPAAPPVPAPARSSAPEAPEAPEAPVVVPGDAAAPRATVPAFADATGAVALAEAPAAVGLEDVRDAWPAVLAQVKDNGLLHACLAGAQPVALEGGALTLGFALDQGFAKRKVESGEHRTVLAEAIRSLTGLQPRLQFELRDLAEVAPAEEPVSEEELLARLKHEFQAEEILEDPDTAKPEEA